jgi:hypothetical protein
MSTPFFVVSSGRSGTAMLAKALSLAPEIQIKHEYAVLTVQPLAVRRYAGLASENEARATLARTHGAAARLALTKLWGDSSNKLSWLIPDLAALFPEAKFVHLVRDGRKVASSYFHKLAAECYDDTSTAALTAYLADPSRVPAPPVEKKYWWPQPLANDPIARKFARFDQFQRICWHWAEINRVIVRDLDALPDSRKLFVRLEDLRTRPSEVASLFQFLGARARDEYFGGRLRQYRGPDDGSLRLSRCTRISGRLLDIASLPLGTTSNCFENFCPSPPLL